MYKYVMLCSPTKANSKAQKKAIYSTQGFCIVLGLWGREIGPTNPQLGVPGTAHLNVEQQADLATERECHLTTARANQTNGLTNSREANLAPEVVCSPFRALSSRQLTFPFCC